MRMGIVGVGYAGSIHLRNLLNDKRITVHGIYDIAKWRMDTVASSHGLRRYASYEEMTDDPELDAVYVCTPNAFHATQTLAALKNSKHVFCEKPMALKLDDAKQIARTVQNTKLKYQIGFNRRFCPAYRHVKKLIDDGKVEPVSLNIRLLRSNLERPAWVKDPSVSGGLLFESTVHAVDLTRWLLGEISEVNCHTERLVYDQPDTFTITMRTPDGRMANIFSIGYAKKTVPFERVEVFGRDCEVVVEEFRRVFYRRNVTARKDFSYLGEVERWGFTPEDRYFVDSLLNGRDTVVDEDEGLRSIELLSACNESIARNKPVRVC